MYQKNNLQKFSIISQKICDRILEVLQAFDISEYTTYNNRISLSCPIHGGDNPEGCQLFFMDIHTYVPNWKCYTHQCEKEWGNGLFGFIRGLIGVTQGLDSATIQHGHAIQWCENFLNEDINVTDNDFADKYMFTVITRNLNQRRNIFHGTVTREMVRKSLLIPSQHYIQLGFSETILDKYDVGVYKIPHKSMNNRIVVPVYDDDYNLVVGYVGKSIYPQCPKCKLYHSTKVACPVYRYQKMLCSKWKNSPNFAAEDYLYNYWFAKDYIKNSGIAILVEGQSDVWRMVEANFHNVVGLFGTSLTTHQQLILEQSGAIKLVLCLDGDTAGKRAAELIKKQCGHIFTIDVINLSHNIDPGQLFCFQLRQILYDYILEKQTN